MGKGPARSGLRWTKHETETLLALRKASVPHLDIAARLERSNISCRLHLFNVLHAGKETEGLVSNEGKETEEQPRKRARAKKQTRSKQSTTSGPNPALPQQPLPPFSSFVAGPKPVGLTGSHCDLRPILPAPSVVPQMPMPYGYAPYPPVGPAYGAAVAQYHYGAYGAAGPQYQYAAYGAAGPQYHYGAYGPVAPQYNRAASGPGQHELDAHNAALVLAGLARGSRSKPDATPQPTSASSNPAINNLLNRRQQ
ncbi:collagen-like protein [Teratosphaeria destructans]|uniref:Collagen-like protein n=1 Tax=Teratosphaeria destructans TaxID=418781 RepID=A0A9W7SSY7_9PEZI|nr:collagen-like protein [Teratosphaeria destructans]